MNSLIKHAEYEMKKAGLYDSDADYGGMLPNAVIALIKTHSEQGHSGASSQLTLDIFNRLVNFKTLSPITSDPNEWLQHTHDVWQNTRQGSTFSEDGGKTWYDIDDPEKKNWPNHKN